jgi:hypothetical protein
MQSGAAAPATHAVGAIRATVEAANADRALLERLLGGLTFNLEIQANPDERDFYAQQSYGNATCQATMRYPTSCTRSRRSHPAFACPA